MNLCGYVDIKSILNTCETINKHLVGLEINRVFNSVGSNIFFEFGKDREVSNGKEGTGRECAIWIGNASWRISKNGKYIIGSNDCREDIHLHMQEMLGKCFQSFQFLSQFLDVVFNFDEGYQITTFFNWMEEDQWTIFLPDKTNIGIDLSNYEEIQSVRENAKCFPVIEYYKELNYPHEERVITDITYKNNEHPIFNFESKFYIDLRFCDWRIEKDENYLIGYTDLYLSDDKNNYWKKIGELVGKRIIKIEVNSFMEGRFQFEDQYVIKTFACLRLIDQWGVLSKENHSFHAKIQLEKA